MFVLSSNQHSHSLYYIDEYDSYSFYKRLLLGAWHSHITQGVSSYSVCYLILSHQYVNNVKFTQGLQLTIEWLANFGFSDLGNQAQFPHVIKCHTLFFYICALCIIMFKFNVIVTSVLKSGLVRFLDPNEVQLQPQPVWTAHPYSGNRTESSTTGLRWSICGLATGLDGDQLRPVATGPNRSLDRSFNTLYKSLHKKMYASSNAT